MNQSTIKYVLGLDLGIASIGWSLMIKNETGQLTRIENLGIRIFSPLEDGKSGKLANEIRRTKRGQRRLRRRKHLRLQDTKNLFSSSLLPDFEKFEKIDFKSYLNPYEIKIKGLTEPLTKEELSIALYHYMKYRGFKSNRKVEDKKNDGVLIKQFEDVENQLKENNATITQLLYKQFLEARAPERRIHNVDNAGSLYNKKEQTKSIRNKDDKYNFSATRDMYLKEINLLLDHQISCGLINTSFKEQYLQIFNRQRSFSMGPGKGSPYAAPEGMSLISKMIGVCTFDQLPRAPKASFSSESFVLLSFLNNLQFKEKQESNYRGLTEKEIQSIYNFALKTSALTYKNIFNTINIPVYRIKGLEFSKKQYVSILKAYKKKNKINTPSLNEEQYENFQQHVKNELFSSKIVSLSHYHSERKILEKYAKEHSSSEEEINTFIQDTSNFDIINEILLQFKVDQEIINACLKKGISNHVAQAIITLPSIDKTINLSIDLCKKLIPHLLENQGYDKAMDLVGHNHSNINSSIEKTSYLPDINECVEKMNESLTNVNVRHTLVEMRKLINEIIKNYGYIHEIHIEFARELAKNFQDRLDIKNQQLENQTDNIHLKLELINKYPHFFHSLNNIKGETLLKYKLYREQNYKCAYSNRPISENELFDSSATQIDHIMPYSRTFENRSFNKVLVFTSYNQVKKNRLPYEAFKDEKWQKILDFLNDPAVRISAKKKEIILLKEIDDNEWLERNLYDTKYMSVLAKKIIDAFLKPEKCRAITGAITSKIKYSYGLTNLTHSFISNNYRRFEHFYIQSYNFSSNEISFIIKDNLDKTHTILVSKIKNPDKKILSHDETTLNDALQYFLYNQDALIHHVGDGLDESIDFDKLIEQIAIKKSKANDPNQSLELEYLITILGNIKNQLITITNTKDRSNHLHHALDATIIACVDDKMIYRIQNYEKMKEVLYDETTGEELSTCHFELPYPDFRNEVIYRIYERNYETLLKKLSALSNYKNYNFDGNHCYVIYPSRSVKKVTNGPLTKDTMFGFDEKLQVITKRVSVHEISEKNIDSIINKNGGSNAQYECIKKWLADGKPTQFPILPGKGNYIKKVILEESDNVRKRVQLKEKRFAANSEVIRVNIYKQKNNDEQLYFVPIYLYQLMREQLRKKGHKIQEVFYQLMPSPTDKQEFISSEQLDLHFDKILSLPRYSLIQINLKKGPFGYCYSGGLTSSGKFEIYSILGDDEDLFNFNLITSFQNQYQQSISTFESIELHKVSILGKIT